MRFAYDGPPPDYDDITHAVACVVFVILALCLVFFGGC